MQTIQCVNKQSKVVRAPRRGMMPATAAFSLLLLLGCVGQAHADAQVQTPTPVAAEDGSTTAHHGLFGVKVAGDGSPVILLPGLSSSGAVWDGTVEHLKADHRCYSLTLAGFAGEPAWPQINKGKFLVSVEDELAAYIRAQGLDRPTIVGHSLGGTIALQFAERYPELAGRLVIVDSLPFLAEVWFQTDSLERADSIALQIKLAMTNETRQQYDAYVRSGASSRSLVTSDANFGVITDWGLKSDQATVAESMYEMLTLDARGKLGRIHGPTLIFATWAGLKGASSSDVAKVFKDQYSELKQKQIVVAGNERHFVMLDNPTWFYTQLDHFMTPPTATAQVR